MRNLVSLHGGTVSASSECGRGTEVTVRLPRSTKARAEVTEPVRTEPPSVSDAAEGARVLVVDDNRDAADLIGEFLGAMGYQVTVVHDGAAALGEAQDVAFDIAVIDIGLPIMDGYELGRRLLELRPMRVIAVTGYGAASDRERSEAAGFEAHLVKPVRTEALLAAIRGPTEP